MESMTIVRLFDEKTRQDTETSLFIDVRRTVDVPVRIALIFSAEYRQKKTEEEDHHHNTEHGHHR
jgi:hypothetical protein